MANANRRRKEILSWKRREGIKLDRKCFNISYGMFPHPIALWLSASLVEDKKSDHVKQGTDNKGNETVSVEHCKNKKNISSFLSLSLSLTHTHTHTHTLSSQKFSVEEM